MASSAEAPSRLNFGDSNQAFIYGTAWKKDQTKRLVREALAAGFRKVDTAAQPRHYQEELVGQAIRETIREGVVRREDLYVQTKYTTPAGQDLDNMPYHPLDSLDVQIRTSVASSLRNLRPTEESEEGSYADCLLLHSPLPTIDQTIEAWKILETYVPEKIRALGISNVTLPVLKSIYENSTIKPSVVQNRFYPKTQYDVPLREFCLEHDISYQSFWTLTGNPTLLKSEPVMTIAKSTRVDDSVALYGLVSDLGIAVLNGTTSSEHMKQDLDGIQKIREWAGTHEKQWLRATLNFRELIKSS
ncbi:aldo-keto reductase-like protein [Melanomma pulvis-pyrius CBS 109.77]|uniref:Aldo-keto reductase-like protein n=1 Tax=Melanomma pulvis-pyrius CBS 109.77 TaxID=1314802 RepID=A0A6A6WRY8_9PLEO|nr:aldo-keto reductase-like protein [Melanomma pulvis-pyrius CBS 109.77]